MGRAVYIKKGPVSWVAGSLFLATCAGVVWAVWQALRWAWRHQARTVAAVTTLVAAAVFGLENVALIAVAAGAGSVIWWAWWPVSFARWVANPARFVWRRGWYRREWRWLAFGCDLGHRHVEHQVLTHSRQVIEVPKLRRIRCSTWIDRLTFRPLVGQTAEDWERQCDALALSLGARECRIVAPRAGLLRLDVVWEDTLAIPVPALPVGDGIDPGGVAVGLREDGEPWTVRLTGNHLLVAGVTSAGKSSVLWSLIRGVAPAVHKGTVELWGIDPKGGMEFQPGRPLFTRFAAGDIATMTQLLEAAVATMTARAARYSDLHIRKHTPTVDEPLIVVLVDELAFLTAYTPDRKQRDAINQLLATLLTQGRAVGVCVIAALQDPRKEVIGYRNLFPTKVALRLDEKTQVDMVLGDGARDAGAYCDRIPEATPGVGYVKVDGVREPIRVRAAYVSDDDIDLTADQYPAPGGPMGSFI
jgi:S-DNA-T family DNA segregation ATPase FtsK/SpoIIIE